MSEGRVGGSPAPRHEEYALVEGSEGRAAISELRSDCRGLDAGGTGLRRFRSCAHGTGWMSRRVSAAGRRLSGMFTPPR